MPNKTEEGKIQCPFYLRATEKSISCEGFAAGTCMSTRFPDIKKKAAHEKQFCFRIDGGGCYFAKILYEKYAQSSEK